MHSFASECFFGSIKNKFNNQGFMKYFILAFCLFFSSSIFADRLTSDIESKNIYSDIFISSFEESRRSTEILLNNGTAWTYRDIGLFDGQSCWQVGDRVQIAYSQIFNGEYYLQNMSYQGYIPVKISSKTSQEPTLKIQDIKVFYEDDNLIESSVTLDDNSNWHIGGWSSKWMDDWSIGDHIVISPADFLFGKATHYLINTDRKSSSTMNKLPPNVRAELYSCEKQQLLPSNDLNKRSKREWRLEIVELFNVETIDGIQFGIELSNGMFCAGKMPLKNWNVGDRIYIEVDDEIVLKNDVSNDSIIVTLLNQKNLVAPRIKKITNKGRHITLEDDSMFFFDSIQGSPRWEIGDRIVVASVKYPSIDVGTHYLMNLDVKTKKGYVNYSLTTLIRAPVYY